MKVINHIYAIKNLLAHGAASDDFSFSDRLILHFLQVSRSKLLEQKIDKYYYVSEQSYQSLCVELAKSSFHNCCEAPDAGCQVLKSTIEIPKFLNSRYGNHLKVMDLTGRVIPELNMTQVRFSEYALVPPETGWFMHSNRIYVINNTSLVMVLLNALFNDPEQISLLNCPIDGDTCPEYFEEEFPIDSDLVDAMYRMTMELLLQSYRLPNDSENNTKNVETVQSIQ